MTILMVAGLALVGTLAAAAVFRALASRRFRVMAEGLATRVVVGAPMSEAALPDIIRSRAQVNGGGRDGPLRAARLTQEAEFRRTPEAAWGPMPALQHMGLGTSAFVWNARAPGPVVPFFTVIDAYVGGQGVLRANLLGAIPVANATGAVCDRAEAMRYLAELAWVPDAVLGNPEIAWTDLGGGVIGATLQTGSGDVSVRFTLNADGDFAEMSASRPDLRPDGTEFTREWRGRYADYGWVGGRRIPLAGEVGYVEDGTYWGYWRGRITALELLP
jgi:hypothetical protein